MLRIDKDSTGSACIIIGDLGERRAKAYGDNCEDDALVILTALANPDLYAAIQAQNAELKQLRPAADRVARLEKQLADAGETQRRTVAELIRLQGIVAERNNTIAARDNELKQLRDGLADLRSRYAEADALNSYVLEAE